MLSKVFLGCVYHHMCFRASAVHYDRYFSDVACCQWYFGCTDLSCEARVHNLVFKNSVQVRLAFGSLIYLVQVSFLGDW